MGNFNLIDTPYTPETEGGVVGSPYYSEDIKKYSLNYRFLFVVFYKTTNNMVRQRRWNGSAADHS